MANKFYSILFVSINDQQLKKEEEKKKLDAAEKQKDEEKKKHVGANLAAFYESKNSLEDHDKETVVKEKNAREGVEVAKGILKHGTESLVAAKRGLTALGVTTVMIQSSQEKMAAVEEQLKNLDEERKRIHKRKTELLFSSEVELKKKKD